MSATAHGTAEKACLDYLIDKLGGVKNESAFLGDILPLKSGVWTFQISGGVTQDQNFQVSRPSVWNASGHFAGQYVSREAALDVLDKIIISLPAKRRDGTVGCKPNVRVFEVTSYPNIGSQEIQDPDSGEEATVYVLTAQFRVVFTKIEAGA